MSLFYYNATGLKLPTIINFKTIWGQTHIFFILYFINIWLHFKFINNAFLIHGDIIELKI